VSSAEPHLNAFHPAVRRWFESTFEAATPAQRAAWPRLLLGESVLLLAPTGSGKTLAAFLVAIDGLLRAPHPRAKTRVVYVSPLKALGVDIERNLSRPLAGIREVAAELREDLGEVRVGVRSGDTEQRVRAALVKHPPDVLITTPESLYLMLTSPNARETLRDVEVVIIDEIHALAGSKRGAHLFANLERLEVLRTSPKPLQRIGLSATQRPLDEIARLLGGYCSAEGEAEAPRRRPVSVLDLSVSRAVEVTVELPAEATRDGDSTRSAWPSIHPRLLELVRTHRSTMIFVNNRRLAERLSSALNELAGEELVLAHHGSIAKAQRASIEERLKGGELRAVVTTSSLELGIDIGSVDLVVQVEAPLGISSGIQRIGRAGHHVGGVPRAVFFPKFEGDLVATAAATAAILAQAVEETRVPKNPLDVLAQIIVAEVATGPQHADALFALLRCAAPFHDLPRAAFDGVLDMLSGHYPSERFREFRARISWDRTLGVLSPRRGTRLLAVQSGGTIPDRGLFGVYMTGAEPPLKVGELDEEMVFESRTGDVFLLGASSWRIDDISQDRVLVSPAPGTPGKMPFWRGPGFGRSYELGLAIGRLLARVEESDEVTARAFLRSDHRLDELATSGLLRYVSEQRAASALPTHERVVVECFGSDGRSLVVVLSPFGGRVHAPWALAVVDRLRRELGVEVDSTFADDGMIFRLPDTELAPALTWFLPDAEQARRAVEVGVAQTALFAGQFRENAARALLLPRRGGQRRTPLWLLARRARDLLQVSREYPDFPIVLETYRSCLTQVYDMNALERVLDGLRSGAIRAELVPTRAPSPFAAALLFAYAGNFIYDNDTPVAERRAQALTLDFQRLKQLLGEPELRTLLDEQSIETVVRRLQRLEGARRLETEDDLCDVLWELGDLSSSELHERVRAAAGPVEALDAWLTSLGAQRRLLAVSFGEAPLTERRFLVVEDAALYRDALGIELPADLPPSLLEPVKEALSDLVLRYARTHGPFTLYALVERFGVPTVDLEGALATLASRELLVRGAFLPNGTSEEYCHPDVLARIRHASLGQAVRQSSAVTKERFADWLAEWHGIGTGALGDEALLSAIEKLQGLELPFDELESEILPARVDGFRPTDLDKLCSGGELVWTASSEREPKVRLFLSEQAHELLRPGERAEGELVGRVREFLRLRGASFYGDLVQKLGGFEPDVFAALWRLVWSGEVSNDTLSPLRSLIAEEPVRGRASLSVGHRSRRKGRPGSEGRWFLLAPEFGASDTEYASALGRNLLVRHGVVTRETVRREALPGGFATLYPVLRAMEERGFVRRGYFVDGLGGVQFAYGGAEGGLRAVREGEASVRVLAACDPANPYGAALSWPSLDDARFARVAGAAVVLSNGELLAYLSKGGRGIHLFFERGDVGAEASLVSALDAWFERRAWAAWLLETVDGQKALLSPWVGVFERAGFGKTSDGLRRLRGR
jgi:ATP-dependent helicase Lhr and Lhr-like helicase